MHHAIDRCWDGDGLVEHFIEVFVATFAPVGDKGEGSEKSIVQKLLEVSGLSQKKFQW